MYSDRKLMFRTQPYVDEFEFDLKVKVYIICFKYFRFLSQTGGEMWKWDVPYYITIIHWFLTQKFNLLLLK